MNTETAVMTYDDALATFLATRGSFGGGLTNHGPMASEALDHMGASDWIGSFVAAYRPRLDARTRPPLQGGDWHRLLGDLLPGRVADVEAEAGHCLLRVAHAVRGIERAAAVGDVSALRIQELRTALTRWRPGSGVAAPTALTGSASIDDWSAALGELATFEARPGLITHSLEIAAQQPGYVDVVASLQRSDRVVDTLDRLAMRSLDGYLSNDGLARFTLLHGVTVSTMARVLVDHLDEPAQRRLEAAVAGFVAAAAIAFDRRTDTPDEPPPSPQPDLPARAAATLDDHTIKFTDACIGLADRTASETPLRAAELQIALTS